MTHTCRLFAVNPTAINSKNGNNSIATVDIERENYSEHFVVSKAQNVMLNIGDSVKCVSGAVFILIKPGTGAGGCILSANPALPKHESYKTEFIMTEESTRTIPRGKIYKTSDIGNIQRGTLSIR